MFEIANSSQISSNVPKKITSRSTKSRYPKQIKEKAKQETSLTEIREENIKNSVIEIDENQMDLDLESKIMSRDEISGILVYRKSKLSRGFGEGWDLIFPSGNGPDF